MGIGEQVTDAVKVGASAIKEHHVTLDEVHTCLEELNQAISEQKETQEALGEDFPNLFPTPPSFFIVHLNFSFSRINP